MKPALKSRGPGGRRRPIVWVLLAVAATASCSEDSAVPGLTPGELTAVLSSPHGAEGALLVDLDGPVSSVTAPAGRVYRSDEEERTRLLFILDEAGEIRFQVSVPDVRRPPDYRILEVAGPDDAIRGDVGGYSLEFGS